jgi:hypothetical protein
MRLLIDTLIATMALGLLGVVLWTRSGEAEHREEVSQVRVALDELRTTAAYHGALGHLSNSPAGYPVHMMPEWFADAMPVNVLLPGSHPWIDLAPPGDNALHPPDPVAFHEAQAGFWYNPNVGIFRARVPAGGSSTSRLDLYNRIHHAELAALPESGDADRTPQAYRPGATFATFASNYAPGTRSEGRAIDPDGDGTLVIEWVSGDPTEPPATIHELPDRWTVPDPAEQQGDAEDLASPHTTAEKTVAGSNTESSDSETPHAQTDTQASDDSASKPQRSRRPTLGDLPPAGDTP